MRRWSQESKQSLRLLAAARYYLPQHLDSPTEVELEYRQCLHHGEFPQALQLLEDLGDLHAGHEDELQFWKELYFAAQQMGLPENALRYEARLQEALHRPQV